MRLLADLNIVKEDLLTLRVSLFELNQEFSWIKIVLAVVMRSSILSQWKKTFVSSANILIFPAGQQFGRSLINRRKNNGPSTQP